MGQPVPRPEKILYEIRLGEGVKRKLYKYAGFLFGYTGRLVFMLFLATLCFAVPVAPSYFNYRKTSIYAGSNEIQRNIMAKMVLGL